MVMKVVPSARPRSNIRQTLRWLIFRASFSSFEKRSIVSLSKAISGLRSLRAIFSLIVGVVDLVDASHAAVAQLLDDLVAAGEEWSPW